MCDSDDTAAATSPENHHLIIRRAESIQDDASKVSQLVSGCFMEDIYSSSGQPFEDSLDKLIEGQIIKITMNSKKLISDLKNNFNIISGPSERVIKEYHIVTVTTEQTQEYVYRGAGGDESSTVQDLTQGLSNMKKKEKVLDKEFTHIEKQKQFLIDSKETFLKLQNDMEILLDDLKRKVCEVDMYQADLERREANLKKWASVLNETDNNIKKEKEEFKEEYQRFCGDMDQLKSRMSDVHIFKVQLEEKQSILKDWEKQLKLQEKRLRERKEKLENDCHHFLLEQSKKTVNTKIMEADIEGLRQHVSDLKASHTAESSVKSPWFNMDTLEYKNNSKSETKTWDSKRTEFPGKDLFKELVYKSPNRVIFIGNLTPFTQKNDIAAHIMHLNFKEAYDVIPMGLDQSCYCIFLRCKEDEDTILKSDNWPKGVKIRLFVRPQWARNPRQKGQKSLQAFRNRSSTWAGHNSSAFESQRSQQNHGRSQQTSLNRRGQRRGGIQRMGHRYGGGPGIPKAATPTRIASFPLFEGSQTCVDL